MSLGGGYMLPFATGLVVTEVAHLLGIWHHSHELELVPKPQHLLAVPLRELWLFPVVAVLIQIFISVKVRFLPIVDLPFMVTIFFATARRNPGGLKCPSQAEAVGV